MKLKLLATVLSLGMLWAGSAWADPELYSAAMNPNYAPRYTVNKFGVNVDIDTNEESIWDAEELGGPERCFTILGTTPATVRISSSDAGDTLEEVTIEYLDSTWAAKEVTIALGIAAATTGTIFTEVGVTMLRINRAYATSTALAGDIYIHTDTGTDTGTDGIPDIPASQIVAVISAGENQTLQACYTVPLGYNALMSSWIVSNEGTGATVLVARIRAAVNGGSSRTKMKMTLTDGDIHHHTMEVPMLFAEKTDIELTGAGATSQDAAGLFDLVLILNRLSGI
jgi:hypothetical protein